MLLDNGETCFLQAQAMSDRSAGVKRVEVGHPGGQSPKERSLLDDLSLRAPAADPPALASPVVVRPKVEESSQVDGGGASRETKKF
jgi:hypothetical protein